MLCKYVIELIYVNGNVEIIDNNYNYERIKLTKELLKKYDRVIHDEMVKKLICYNKLKSVM